MFKNIEDATDQLIEILPALDKSWLLVPISESGEKIADIISEKLGLESKRVFTQSIFCKKNIDCEIAMISEFKDVIFDEVLQKSFEINRESLLESIEVMYDYKLIQEIERCRGIKDLFSISEHISKVLIIDETIETGLRMELAIKTLKRFQLETISIAIPIVPEQMFSLFEKSVKNIFYSQKVEFYTEIKDYYKER